MKKLIATIFGLLIAASVFGQGDVPTATEYRYLKGVTNSINTELGKRMFWQHWKGNYTGVTTNRTLDSTNTFVIVNNPGNASTIAPPAAASSYGVWYKVVPMSTSTVILTNSTADTFWHNKLLGTAGAGLTNRMILSSNTFWLLGNGTTWVVVEDQ